MTAARQFLGDRVPLLVLSILFLMIAARTATAGSVLTWGTNDFGQLGDGTTAGRADAALVPGLTDIVAVAGGVEYSLALKGDGAVLSWGNNADGGLGDGTFNDRLVPGPVSGLPPVTGIAAGWFHSLALDATGKVWRWGNYSGPFGSNPAAPDLLVIDSAYPVPVPGLSDITSVAGGGRHSLALRTDGTVWGWGANGCGQLGTGSTVNSPDPVQVNLPPGIRAVAAGVEHSMALAADGRVWAWGRNDYGQLGDGSTIGRAFPAPVPGLTEVVAIFAGGWHSLAMKADGTVWAWGWNSNGQLGNGTTADSSIPVQVRGLSDVVAIRGECLSSFALKVDGTVWDWGLLYDGGGRHVRPLPQQVPGAVGVGVIAGGMDHRIALTQDPRLQSLLPRGTEPVMFADLDTERYIKYAEGDTVHSSYGTESAGSTGAGGSPAVRPATVTVPIISRGTFTVSWSASATPGATYTVEESISPAFEGSAAVYSGPLTSVSLSRRDMGTFYYRVRASAAGLTDSDWLAGTVGCLVDSVPPTVAMIDPAPGRFIAGRSHTIRGSAFDSGSGVQRVEVSVDGGNTWHAANGTTSWSYSWTPAAEGTYALAARVFDLARNVAEASPVTVVLAGTRK